MIRRLVCGVVLASVTATSVAGCSDDSGDDKPTKAQLAWAGRICGTVKQSGATLRFPTVDPKNGPKSKSSIVKFLRDLSGSLKAQEATLRAAGAPPVDGGRAGYDTALANLTKVGQEVGATADALAKAKVKDKATLTRSLTDVGQKLARFNSYQGPTKDLRANPRLGAAFDQSSDCQRLGT
ncbi:MULTISPECIES: hypothetical protein [Actinomadura]|uniref:Small secreted protein n=1 Tax=Actinomadura yumaensis TaxID=111807 RepID=A0ABW2CH93_9ACTN|nr:hypothetical protein [Actinomadura sp. J1-007]MWK34782.1 hypothetical protein [Actinomadura sp. J1-007]